MDSKSLKSFLQQRAEEMAPGSEIDLWPAIQARLSSRQSVLPNTLGGSKMKPAYKQPAWRGAFGILSVFVVLTLIIAVVLVSVPGAANAMRRLFGYIPEVGIVEKGTPIRVLAEPASLTREGISVTVTSALLTNDRTHLEYRVFGVPGSAYPNREDVTGCMQFPYLRLPDGSQLTITNADYPPIPSEVNEATFVMPCILDTLPGKAPMDWELPLRFKPAPPDLTVMPVVDIPTQQPTLAPEPSALPVSNPPESAQPAVVDTSVKILKEIETPDGYILAIQLPFSDRPGAQMQIQGNSQGEIRDAKGKVVAYSFPIDMGPSQLGLDPAGSYWFVQFKAAGLTYPLTISFSGNTLKQAEPGATAEFSFDAGSNPQMGQEWKPDQDIQLAGHTLRLRTIRSDSRNGYSFSFQCDPDIVSADFEILGYTATGWGGGGGCYNGTFERHLSYGEYPTGPLTVRMSNLVVTGDPLAWQGQWSPANPRTDLPANPTPQPGLCLAAGGLEGLAQIPDNLSSGKALVYEQLQGSDQWGLVLYSLEDGQKQIVAAESAWGALSPDGSQVAYSPFSKTAVDIHIMDLASQSVHTLPAASGTGYRWSPDGKQIAYVGLDGAFIINADGSQNRQVSGFSYGSIAGWSPDGKHLYYVIPYTGGAAWKVYSFDLGSGVTKELFTLENGTPKFLNPKLSPDGQWIAYNGRDNSLYLIRTNGSDMHLVLDNLGVAGMEWTQSGWLGVSLRQADSDRQTLALVNPDTCEAYRLIDVGGEMEGLFVP